MSVAEVPPVRLTVYTRLPPPSATLGVPLMDTTRGGATSVMVPTAVTPPTTNDVVSAGSRIVSVAVA